MDVIFFGSGEFGLPTLERLAASHRIIAVVTQPDRPAGRGARLAPTPVGAWAAENLPGVPLLKPQRADDDAVVEHLRCLADAPAKRPDSCAFVVIAYGQKLPQRLIQGVFAINLHASLLPRWRGAAPINAAIIAGDRKTGNSVITLAERMDAGLVLAQSRRRIEPGMTASDLHDLLAADGAPLVEQVLRDAAAGALRPQPQDDALATRAPKLSRADGWVDFAAPTLECHGRINGLSPWPGVTVQFRSRPLRLLRATTDLKSVPAEPIKAAKTLAEAGAVTPGKLISGPEGLLFCGDRTLLRLLEVQPPGKRVMSWRDFANGHAVKSEEVLVGGRPSC